MEKKRSARDRSKSAKALFLEIDPTNNHILVTGEETSDNGNSYIKTIRYDDLGNLLWENIHDGHPIAPESPTGLLVGNNETFIVTGVIKEASGEQEYETIKYESKIYNMTVDYNGGTPVNVNNEIIIRFYPTVIDTAFADNPNVVFGTIDEIITDDILINKMDDKLRANGKIRKWKMIKQYPFLNTSNRTFMSKYGDVVPLSSLWATYRLLLEGNLLEKTVVDSLNAFDFEHIVYATTNSVGQLNSMPPPPNDPHYGLQAGLHEVTGFENAHINIESAWNRVDGDASIKVGFVDTGLEFSHPDFNTDGVDYGGLGGSIVAAGFDFRQDPSFPISWDDNNTGNDPDWPHGTRMAGIVGALRNNGIGISGVAGGDVAGGNGPGVKLIAFQAMYPTGGLFLSFPGYATLFAATGGSGSGPMVDVLNNSYGKMPDVGGTNQEFIKDYLIPAYKSGMIFVASRGNSQPNATQDEHNFPATLSEKMVINVGGSGTDGRLKETVANSSGAGVATNENFMSMYGKEMDIIAPATSNLIVTTNNLQNTSTIPLENVIECDLPLAGFSNNPDYNCFNGTSSSTAFVSGVAALLLEQHETEHNIILAHEDIERLLEYGATDIDDNGYDNKNAWGQLNAGQSIDFISGTQKVVHFQVVPEIEEVCETCVIKLVRPYDSPFSIFNGTGMFPPEFGITVRVRKHTYNVNINFCSAFNAQIIDPGIDKGKDPAWLLHSRSNLWGKAFQELPIVLEETIVPEDEIYWDTPSGIPEIDNTDCILSGTIAGYSYYVTQSQEVIPNDGNEDQVMWFSVLVDDPMGTINGDITTAINELKLPDSQIILFPNPTKDQLAIRLNNTTRTKIEYLEVYNMSGQLLQIHAENKSSKNAFEWQLNTANFPSGMYIIKISADNGFYQSRFIKL